MHIKEKSPSVSHPAENMHKPKVYMKGQGPQPKLVVGMVQSCESQPWSGEGWTEVLSRQYPAAGPSAGNAP